MLLFSCHFLTGCKSVITVYRTGTVRLEALFGCNKIKSVSVMYSRQILASFQGKRAYFLLRLAVFAIIEEFYTQKAQQYSFSVIVHRSVLNMEFLTGQEFTCLIIDSVVIIGFEGFAERNFLKLLSSLQAGPKENERRWPRVQNGARSPSAGNSRTLSKSLNLVKFSLESVGL